MRRLLLLGALVAGGILAAELVARRRARPLVHYDMPPLYVGDEPI
jgi:hypothetical protein